MPPQPLPGFPPPSAAPAEIELRPAKINDRFIAYILDAAPFAAGYALTLMALVKLHMAPQSREFVLRVAAVWAGVYLLYQWMGNAAGATLGKKLMGIKVVGRDGGPLGPARGLLRALGYVLSTPLCNLGFVIALFHPESRALHDLISGSLVIESQPKAPAEASVLFLGAVSLLLAIFGGTATLYVSLPTPEDLLAIEKAREGLQVLARIEEACKKSNGTYTQSLGELAAASGDVEQFKSAMGEIFDPNLFQIQAGHKGYRISAAAKDRRRTRVAIEGPPPAPAD